MRTPARILIADDNLDNLDIFRTRLAVHDYEVLTAVDGDEALSVAREKKPDLVLLDIMMPKMDGIDVCRQLKTDPSLPFMPIIMITAKTGAQDVVTALDAGADEYLTKPVDHGALVARVKSMLRIKALTDTVQAQSKKLSEWNATLEKRVSDQLSQLESLSRLKRFFSPQLVEAMLCTHGPTAWCRRSQRSAMELHLLSKGVADFMRRSQPAVWFPLPGCEQRACGHARAGALPDHVRRS